MIRVISGGQDGADLAGWKAAKLAGLPTAGTMPLGYLTETGPKPHYADLYGAVEHNSPLFPPRTIQNVRDSDATILFVSARAKSHRGCDLTRKACADLKRPILAIPVWSIPDLVPATARVADLIRAKGFKTVNIAGTRASSDPEVAGVPGSGIEAWVTCYCIDLFSILKG